MACVAITERGEKPGELNAASHCVQKREKAYERKRHGAGRKALWEHECSQQIFNCLLAKSLPSICITVYQSNTASYSAVTSQ